MRRVSDSAVRKAVGMKNRKGEAIIELRATQVLMDFGVPASVKGYEYLRHCIIETYYDTDITLCITKTLYPRVARLCGATDDTVVARTCRRAVTDAIKRASASVARKYFGVEPYRISCGQFFTAIANYLHTEYDGEIWAADEESFVAT